MDSLIVTPVEGIVWLAAFLSAAVAVVVTRNVLVRRRLLDIPNERSSHIVPTPRGGGVGIALGAAAGMLVAATVGLPVPSYALVAGSALVFAIGLYEDWVGPLLVPVRLLGQCTAAIFVLEQHGPLERFPFPAPADFSLGFLGYLVGLLWIVGVVNIYNFLDGIDGYAGLQGVIAAIAVWVASPDGVATAIALALGGACSGFLVYNWRPASIFMGDSGALLLGFLLASLPFEAAAETRGPMILVVALALWFFLSDGAFTILRRLHQGEKFWRSHRGHLYQRLVQTGRGHDEVVLMIGTAAALLAIAAGLLKNQLATVVGWALLSVASVGFLVYLLGVSVCERAVRAKRLPVDGGSC